MSDNITPNFLGVLAHGNHVLDKEAIENDQWEGRVVSRISLFLASSLVTTIDVLAHLCLTFLSLTRGIESLIKGNDPFPHLSQGKKTLITNC